MEKIVEKQSKALPLVILRRKKEREEGELSLSHVNEMKGSTGREAELFLNENFLEFLHASPHSSG